MQQKVYCRNHHPCSFSYVVKCHTGRRSIQRLDVKNEYARVDITVSASPNVSCVTTRGYKFHVRILQNVYTVDPYCNENNPFGHNTTEELLANTFPSTTAGEGHVTIAISFYPDW